jgi:amino-acid N-acetyltransferase
MSQATLRPATSKDLDSIESLLTSCGLPLDGVSDNVEHFLVAENRGEVVGAIGMEEYGRCGLLRSASVASSAQGKGVGASLVRQILDKARADGIADVFLLTTTAEEYFPRFGFYRVSRSEIPEALNKSEELRGACPQTAIVMRTTL